jgi:hypothetical protein
VLLKNVFIFLSFFIYTSAIKAQTAEEVILKYIKLSGGEKHWKKIKSIVTHGKYSYGGMEFSFTSYSKAPNLYKYVVSLNGKNYIQSYDGRKGWKMDGFNNETTPVFLEGKAAIAMANEVDVELESPLINYGKKGFSAILEGRDSIQAAECFKIKFISRDHEEETYFFNILNYELIMKSAVSKNAEMEHAIINTFYSDYRSVKGVKIPFKMVSKVKEQTVLFVAIDKIDLNVPIADSAFEP